MKIIQFLHGDQLGGEWRNSVSTFPVNSLKSMDVMKRLAPFLKVPFVATKHDMQKKRSFHGLEYGITISDEISGTIKAKQIFKGRIKL